MAMTLPTIVEEALEEYRAQEARHADAQRALREWKADAQEAMTASDWSRMALLDAHCAGLAGRLPELEPQGSEEARRALRVAVQGHAAAAMRGMPVLSELPPFDGSATYYARRADPNWRPTLGSDEIEAQQAIEGLQGRADTYRMMYESWSHQMFPLPADIEQAQKLCEFLDRLREEIPAVRAAVVWALRTRHPGGLSDEFLRAGGWQRTEDGRWAKTGAVNIPALTPPSQVGFGPTGRHRQNAHDPHGLYQHPDLPPMPGPMMPQATPGFGRSG